MEWKKLLLAGGLLFSSLVAASALPADNVEAELDILDERQTTCEKGVYIIGTKGHTPAKGMGKLGSLASKIKNAIPDSTIKVTVYPSQKANLVEANEVGRQNVLGYIQKKVAKCPDAKIVLLGYSQGAVVTYDTICGSNIGSPAISTEYQKNIVAVIGYGDESYSPNQPYNRGTCLTFGPLARINPLGCDPYKDAMQDYCDAQDIFCCVSGLETGDHAVYLGKYDKKVVNFVTKRYNAMA